jgi:hypothetical protein
MRAETLAYVLALAAAACGGASSQSSSSTPVAETTIFSSAPAFAASSQTTTSIAAAAHAAKNVAAPSKSTACLSCHKQGGSAPSFAFAGTIYGDKDATKGAADIEIRLTDANGAAMSVHADADGNFWAKGAALTGTAHVGARSAAKTRLMNQPTTSGDCNTCHAADMPILLTPP